MKEETRTCNVCGQEKPITDFKSYTKPKNGQICYMHVCNGCYRKKERKDYYPKKVEPKYDIAKMVEKKVVAKPEPEPMKELETNRNKAQRYLREAKGAFLDALDVLGRDNNTDAFLRHISERNAALWRWKHTQGGKPATKEEWI